MYTEYLSNLSFPTSLIIQSRSTRLMSWIFRSCMRFSAQKDRIGIDQIRNSNLKFQGDEWVLNLYPFYPQLFKKKGKNVYEISTSATVLALTFINKKLSDETAWNNRRSIALKFKEVGAILSAEVQSDNEVAIETQSQSKQVQRSKVLKIKDYSKEQYVNIQLASLIEKPRDPSAPREQEPQWQISTKMSHTEYRIMYKLIESSLYELSGWKFMMDFQLKQQLSKVEGMITQDNQFESLINS